jgi:hypothetical protein
LQSQLAKTARKRLSLSGLELLHGRLVSWSFAPPQRIGADEKSRPASHLTLNRLAGALTQCARCRFRQLRLALLPICSTF